MCNKYNGFLNYQTWNVSLWIDNDQGLYDQIHELAQEKWDDNEDKDTATYELEDAIKSLVKDEYYPEVSGMYADLLNHSIDSVDFNEIAQGWIDIITDENQG